MGKTNIETKNSTHDNQFAPRIAVFIVTSMTNRYGRKQAPMPLYADHPA